MKKSKCLVIVIAMLIMLSSCGTRKNNSIDGSKYNQPDNSITGVEPDKTDVNEKLSDTGEPDKRENTEEPVRPGELVSDISPVSGDKEPLVYFPSLVKTTMSETWTEAELVALVRIGEMVGFDEERTAFRAEIVKVYKGETEIKDIFFLQAGNNNWHYSGFPLYQTGDEILVGLTEKREGEWFDFSYPENVDFTVAPTYFARNNITTWMRRLVIDGQVYFYRYDYTYTMEDIENTYSGEETWDLMQAAGCFETFDAGEKEKHINDPSFIELNRFVTEAWVVDCLKVR